MKKFFLVLVAAVAVAFACSNKIWGRGGMGGGGRVGGGGARVSGGGGGMRTASGGARPSMGSMPSMSRPTQSFNRPSGGNIAANRPSGGNRQSLGQLPTPGTRPAGGMNRPNGGNLATNRPNAGQLPNGSRPTQGQLQNFLDLPGAGGATRPANFPGGGAGAAIAGGALAGGAAAEFLHDRPSGGNRPGSGDLAGGGVRPGDGGNRPDRPGDGGNRPDRPGDGGNRPGNGGNRPDRPGNGWANDRPDRINNWNQWNGWRQNNWTNINNNWGDRWHNNWNDCNHWFNNNWWANHPCDGWRWPVGVNWWRWAAWGSIANWIPWGWSQPIYYNYGDNVYYDGDSVYYGDQSVATADEYTEQAEAIANSIPPNVQPAPEDWMPLGVFAVTQDGESASDQPTMFLQLAVSKQGIIAGTYQNTVSGVVKSVEGMVDKETQRAAWTAVGEDRPLMETGLGNLTQDTAGVLVHFANGDTQRWMLARINNPQATNTPN
ncbi:MAG TPA: hypothetical protein VMJ32_18970 [Pirellulales bacterium]|nr:hypothetical protein [Pirellulales bacterium]